MKKLLSTLLLLLITIATSAQDILVTEDGESIKVYNVEVATNSIYFTITQNSEDHKSIPKNKVLVWKKADGSRIVFSGKEENPVVAMQPLISKIDWADFHGCIMAKGNNVFIPTDSNRDYEKAGQECLKKQIEELKFWNVVNEPEQAHFVLQYWVDVKGRDCGYVYARTIDSYKDNSKCMRPKGVKLEYGNLIFAIGYTSEDVGDNIQDVSKMVLKAWNVYAPNTTGPGWFKRLTDENINNNKKLKKKGFIIP